MNGGIMSLLAVVGTGAAAAMIFNILPVFLGKAAESYTLSDSAAGWFGTIYLAGFGFSSASATFWLHRANRQVLALGVFGSAALLLLLGSVLESFSGVAAALFAAGLALGVLYSLSFVLAGEFQDSTQALGIKLGGEVVLGALLLFLLPTFIYPAFGFGGIMAALAVVLLLVSPCVRFIPSAKTAVQPTSPVEHLNRAWIPMPAVAGLVALFAFTLGQSAVWSFVERAGARAGYDATNIGTALSIAVLMGGLGSFIAAAVSVRFGKKPLMLAAIVYTLSIFAFTLGQGFPLYVAATNLFFFIWLFALPYFISAITAADDSGRATSLVAACLAFGSMLGPVTAGQLVQGTDFGLLFFASAGATLAAYALIVGLWRVAE